MTTLPSIELQHQGQVPSLDRLAGDPRNDVAILAANVASFVGMILIAPAALGPTLGLLTPFISLSAQAFFLKDELADGRDHLADKIAKLSLPAALFQAAAIYVFVMMSTLGVFTGIAVTAVLAGATYFATDYATDDRGNTYAPQIMRFLNEKFDMLLSRQEQAQEQQQAEQQQEAPPATDA